MDTISITIKPTNACNMRCKHCYHAAEGFDDKILSIENIEQMLTLAASSYKKINILIIGGEATVCGTKYLSNIFKLEREIETKYECKFRNTIQTNGLLLDEQLIKVFKQNSVNLSISFDGPHNDELREYTKKVYENLCLLQKKEFKFNISCVETNNSIENLIDTYQWFKNENFNYKILPIFLYGNAESIENSIISEWKYGSNMMKLYTYWLYDKECNIRVSTLEEFLILFSAKKESHFRYNWIYHRLALNSDGNVYPCGRPYSNEFCLGKISDVTKIDEFFKTKGYLKLINIVNQRKLNCRQVCEYFSVCNSGCISNSILDGSYSKVGGNSCNNAKILFDLIKPINEKIFNDYSRGDIQKYNPRIIDIINKNIFKKGG